MKQMEDDEMKHDENDRKIMNEFHKDRMNRRRLEIEYGAIHPREPDMIKATEGYDDKELEEMAAKNQLQEYLEAIKARQEKQFKMQEVAEH